MIFTTDNNDTPTIHFVAIICQGSSMVQASAQTPDNYKCYYGDGVDNVFHQNHANLF